MAVRPIAACVGVFLAAASAAAAPPAWVDPPIISPGAGGVVSLDALTGDVTVPGLGLLHGASFYNLRRGAGDTPGSVRRSLMPAVLQIDKGATVELRLQNRLTTIDAGQVVPDATNVHAHGLVVAPSGLGFGTPQPRVGDCVLPLMASKAAGGGGHAGHGPVVPVLSADPCASSTPPGMPVAASLNYAYALAADHPSGLFWLHPHPHGQSEIQLSNGLSGMLAVGSVWDTLFFRCRLTASISDATGACRTQAEQVEERALEATARNGAVRVRYLGLKDVQVKPRGSEYDLIAFPRRPAMADEAFKAANDARKSRCGTPIRPVGADDVLIDGGAPMPQGLCRGPDGTGWVFPVSGQVFPQITVDDGQTELWRIANMSADVSYRLQLKGDDGTLYRMRPVAIDGVAIAAPQGGAAIGMAAGLRAASTSGTAINEIVLMPSARIEVLVERCGPAPTEGCVPGDRDVRAVLHTRGMATGLDTNGDLWPAIDLARVVFTADRARGRALRAALPPMQVAAAPAGPAPLPPTTVPPPAPPAVTPACAGYDHGPAHFGLNDTLVRLIRLNNSPFPEGESFGIHDELTYITRLSTGVPVPIAALLDEGLTAASGPSLISDIRLPDPCSDTKTQAGFEAYYRPFDPARDNVTVRYGTTEYWLVVNDSPECHNFHVHQMKFTVMDADFQGTAAALNGGAPIASDQCAGDRTAIRPINQAAYLDNYPVPPYARILFRLQFDGPKLGRFVFHCHILEHEDKGMMALLNVE